jgi:hypothetical protein
MSKEEFDRLAEGLLFMSETDAPLDYQCPFGRMASTQVLKRFRFEHSGNGITTMPKPAANICQSHFGVRAP